jgi:hypothetical protein
MQSDQNILSDDLGLVFELGVNIGMLAGIRRLTDKKKMLANVHSLYNDELKNMKLKQVVSRLQEKAKRHGVVDPTLLKKAGTFIEYLIFLGVHKGFNFIMEYCDSMESQFRQAPTLLYYQCDLQQLFNTDEHIRFSQLIPKIDKMFKQLDSQITPNYQRYQHRGQFLNADIIMLFQLSNSQYRVLVIDVGLFSVANMTDIPDLDDVAVIKQRLVSAYLYMREKTAFEHLNIDSDTTGIHFSSKLADYFEAFSRDDKDSYKMIQAGGYAYSFVQCLNTLLPQRFNDDTLEINALGLTDRAYNATFISDKADMQILRYIYRESKTQTQGMSYPEKRSFFIQSVFKTISKNFKQTFRLGKFRKNENLTTFLEKLQTPPPKNSMANQIAYTETLKDFHSTAKSVPPEILTEVGLQTETQISLGGKATTTFRDAHARLIEKAMYNNDLLLFLTGHPGIGKTTAIVNYILTPQILSEGVLFFYFSPRIQVNSDIIEKFSQIKNGKRVVKDDNVLCLYSNSNLISNYKGNPVIKYVANKRLPGELSMPSVVGGKQSMLILVPDAEEIQFRQNRSSQTKSSSDNKIEHKSTPSPGVLKTLCSAICTLRYHSNKHIPQNIIATATVQSLKKTEKGSTAQHLRKIFGTAAKDKALKYFDAVKLAQMAKTTRHLIFMVDEVIGDSGGTELLHELVNLARDKELQLAQHFQLKIIASDASIAGIDVIKQHLSKREPSPAKILYRQIDKRVDTQSLSIQQDKFKIHRFKADNATIINANTFPASELVLNYKVNVEMATLEAPYKDDEVQSWILEDIHHFLNDKSADGQAIVYIQNIRRLNQLINVLKVKQSSSFEEFKDYLQIHSIIPNETRQKIHQYKNAVKIIFMTSSASRGLTFASVRHIFIEVPGFQIENNLMEIVQTVYRGRGGETEAEKDLEKQTRWLTFYLNSTIRYADMAQRETRYQRGITGIMNIILLLRAALKTRMTGYGDIGERKSQLRIIPVGDKHLNSVGDSLLTGVGRLLTQIRREVKRSSDNNKTNQGDYDNSLAKLEIDIKNIFKRTQTRVLNKTLTKVNTYYEHFAESASQSFYHLLDYDFAHPYYIDGDILTVPIPDSEERIDVPKDILNAAQAERLVERMYGHTKNPQYADGLKKELSHIAKEIEHLQQVGKETNKSQGVYSQNMSSNQYLSIPLPVLFKPQIFKDYFRPHSETSFYEEYTTERDSFRDVLGHYLYSIYQLSNKLPLDGGYETFPFLLFRCDNLVITRQQRFDRRYLFSSTAFNLINLVLSQD